MRLLVLGAVSGNGGDAAILLAQLGAVRRAAAPEDVVVDVVDYNPTVTRRVVAGIDEVVGMETRRGGAVGGRLRGVTSRVVRLARRAARMPTPTATGPLDLQLPREEVLELLSRADVVLYTGGTSLVEHYRLDEKFAQLRLAVLMGKPLVLGTQSLGPFRRPEHVEMVRRVVEGAAAVLLRDERSLANLRSIGAATEHATVLPDVVFCLADPDDGRRRDGTLRVAVSTRSWVHFSTKGARDGFNRYASAVREAVTWLVRERGAEVTFLSTCQGVPEYWIDDSRTAADIVAELPADVRDRVTVRSDHLDPGALQREYAGFDVVLATRMHAAILALNAGTPVVAIAYEFKTLELFANLGLPDLAHDIEDVTGESLVSSLRVALDTADTGLRERIATTVTTWRDEAGRLGDHVVAAARRPAPESRSRT